MKLMNQVAESFLWGGVAAVLAVLFMAVGGKVMPTPDETYVAAVEKERSVPAPFKVAQLMRLVSKG